MRRIKADEEEVVDTDEEEVVVVVEAMGKAVVVATMKTTSNNIHEEDVVEEVIQEAMAVRVTDLKFNVISVTSLVTTLMNVGIMKTITSKRRRIMPTIKKRKQMAL